MASVSVDQLGPRRFKVRWREWVQEEGARRESARSRTVSTREAAIELQARVLRAVETQGYFELEGKKAPASSNLEAAAAEWVKSKAARGAARTTIRKYAGFMDRFFATVRKLRGLPADGVVPTTVLSRALLSDAVLAWRAEGLGESSVYGTASNVLAMWAWVSDDPESYPGVPAAPRDPSSVLPLPPVYHAPTPPTLAELDACIRHVNPIARVARCTAVLMRFTGLRASQALGVRWEEIDLVNATLVVRVGKTRRERAERRTIPISSHLVTELQLWERGGAENGVVRRRVDQRAADSHTHLPINVLTDAWEEATAAGEARREAWAPTTRTLARPEHAFRAAFMGFLEAEGVRDSAIDFLVGHAPTTTRRRHYAPPDMDQLREAVDKLPPIEWGEAASGGNLVHMRGRRAC